jgi:hypothetical protein
MEQLIYALAADVCIRLAAFVLRRIVCVEAWVLAQLLPDAVGLEFLVAGELETDDPLVVAWRALVLIVGLPGIAVGQYIAEQESPTQQAGRVDAAVRFSVAARFSVSEGHAGAVGRSEARSVVVHVGAAEVKAPAPIIQATGTVTPPRDATPQ